MLIPNTEFLITGHRHTEDNNLQSGFVYKSFINRIKTGPLFIPRIENELFNLLSAIFLIISSNNTYIYDKITYSSKNCWELEKWEFSGSTIKNTLSRQIKPRDFIINETPTHELEEN